jgi:hypothetical protein
MDSCWNREIRPVMLCHWSVESSSVQRRHHALQNAKNYFQTKVNRVYLGSPQSYLGVVMQIAAWDLAYHSVAAMASCSAGFRGLH